MAGHDAVARGHELDRLHAQLDLLADGPAHLLGVADLAQVAGADRARAAVIISPDGSSRGPSIRPLSIARWTSTSTRGFSAPAPTSSV